MPIKIYTRTKFEGLRRMNLHYMLTQAGQSPSPCRWKDNSRNSQINFFISVAFILHFIKSKYRSNNIGRNRG